MGLVTPLGVTTRLRAEATDPCFQPPTFEQRAARTPARTARLNWPPEMARRGA